MTCPPVYLSPRDKKAPRGDFAKIGSYWNYLPQPYLLPIVDELFGKDETTTMQFLLDCSVLPLIIRLSQQSENPVLHDIFYLTRTYVFKLFVTRRRLLGQTTRWSCSWENCATQLRGQNYAMFTELWLY